MEKKTLIVRPKTKAKMKFIGADFYISKQSQAVPCIKKKIGLTPGAEK